MYKYLIYRGPRLLLPLLYQACLVFSIKKNERKYSIPAYDNLSVSRKCLPRLCAKFTDLNFSSGEQQVDRASVKWKATENETTRTTCK